MAIDASATRTEHASQTAALAAHHNLVDLFNGPAQPIAAPSPAVTVSIPLPRAAPPPHQRHRRQPAHQPLLRAAVITARAVTILVLVAVAVWVTVTWPPMRYVVFAAWVGVPLTELALLTFGQLWFHYRYREAPLGKYTQLIIQITTDGRSHDRVTEIIKEIRGYKLDMDYQIWVVTEPAGREDYPLADLVLAVPETFTARSQKKGRALEYSRLWREHLGFARYDVKILFNDDDVTLTEGYIRRAFAADADICQGIITPRTAYAVRPFAHFAVSHADDIRTHACLVYCSFMQGVLGWPVHVHGEGLAVTGELESMVTWDIPLIASEDLAFGQQAAAIKGARWAWFHEYAEVTSPWSVRDFLIQRARWLWGDVHAITHRTVMGWWAAVRVSAKYLAGAAGLICSIAGLYLRATGRIPATAAVLSWAKLSILAWVGVYFACGWIGASATIAHRNNESRLLASVIAVLMMPVSVTLTFAAIVIPLIQGDPRTFKVIAKTKEKRRP